MCWTRTNKKLITLLNMALSIIIGTEIGVALNYIETPKIIIFGAIAVFSTLIEHYLTTNPLVFLKSTKKYEEKKDENPKQKKL